MGFDVYTISLDGVVRYVGATTLGVERRWKEHLSLPRRSCTALSNGIRTHGPHAFTIEHVASAITRDQLLNLEQLVIKQYNTLSPHGYNLRTCGDNGVVTEEAKKRISAAHQGKIGHKNTLETRAKISKANKGRKKSPEWCAALGERQKGRRLSPETKFKIGLANKGRTLSPESRAKIIIANTGRKHTDEERAKMSNGGLGKRKPPLTEEHKAAISAFLTGRKRGPMSEETRQKISATKQAANQIRANRADEHAARSERPLND